MRPSEHLGEFRQGIVNLGARELLTENKLQVIGRTGDLLARVASRERVRLCLLTRQDIEIGPSLLEIIRRTGEIGVARPIMYGPHTAHK